MAGHALPCAAGHEKAEYTPQGDTPPFLNLWEAYHQSPPVSWRQLLRQPFVLWALLLLVCLFLREALYSLRGW
jgi:hypothetical protein